jgi:hypothetical protein
MDILSIGKSIQHDTINITTITESELGSHPNIQHYDYIIISGGDGTIRRVLKTIHTLETLPPFILNPTGSFNVIAKLHKVPAIEIVLEQLASHTTPSTNTQKVYGLNKEVFLFSAGNMGDLQHIFLSETLRFGLLKKGIAKYILAVVFLFPVHLIMTPFMLMSKRRFFIFTPLSLIKKFGSFYGKVEEMQIDLKNSYNLIELDGDIVTIEESKLSISEVKEIRIVNT